MQFFKRILCVVDPGHHDIETMMCALKLAEGQQAALKVVTVMKQTGSSPAGLMAGLSATEIQQSLAEKARQRLEQCAASLHTDYPLNMEILAGVPFLEIIRETQKNKHDLVIKSAEEQQGLMSLAGSEDKHLLRKCPCPVLLLNSAVPMKFKTILAAVDISDNYPEDELTTRYELGVRTLQLATTLALSEFAQLHVICAWQAEGVSFLDSGFGRVPETEVDVYINNVKHHYDKALDNLIEDAFRNLDTKTRKFLELRRHLVQGNARGEIPRQAALLKADVVVMGTIARSGIPGFFIGNTAETILDQLNCSVLALKPAGFVSPVSPAQ